MRRYSLGVRIDGLLAEIIELVATAQFSPKEDQATILTKAITRNDVLKTLLYVLLELQGIEEIHFIEMAQRIEEIGRVLYGWKNHAQAETLQNRSDVHAGTSERKQERVASRTTR